MEWTDPRYAEVVALYRKATRTDSSTESDDQSEDRSVKPFRGFLVNHPTS